MTFSRPMTPSWLMTPSGGSGKSSYGSGRRAGFPGLADLPGIAVLLPGDWCPGALIPDPFDAETDRPGHLPFVPEFQAAGGS